MKINKVLLGVGFVSVHAPNYTGLFPLDRFAELDKCVSAFRKVRGTDDDILYCVGEGVEFYGKNAKAGETDEDLGLFLKSTLHERIGRKIELGRHMGEIVRHSKNIVKVCKEYSIDPALLMGFWRLHGSLDPSGIEGFVEGLSAGRLDELAQSFSALSEMIRISNDEMRRHVYYWCVSQYSEIKEGVSEFDRGELRVGGETDKYQEELDLFFQELASKCDRDEFQAEERCSIVSHLENVSEEFGLGSSADFVFATCFWIQCVFGDLEELVLMRKRITVFSKIGSSYFAALKKSISVGRFAKLIKSFNLLGDKIPISDDNMKKYVYHWCAIKFNEITKSAGRKFWKKKKGFDSFFQELESICFGDGQTFSKNDRDLIISNLRNISKEDPVLITSLWFRCDFGRHVSRLVKAFVESFVDQCNADEECTQYEDFCERLRPDDVVTINEDERYHKCLEDCVYYYFIWCLDLMDGRIVKYNKEEGDFSIFCDGKALSDFPFVVAMVLDRALHRVLAEPGFCFEGVSQADFLSEMFICMSKSPFSRLRRTLEGEFVRGFGPEFTCFDIKEHVLSLCKIATKEDSEVLHAVHDGLSSMLERFKEDVKGACNCLCDDKEGFSGSTIEDVRFGISRFMWTQWRICFHFVCELWSHIFKLFERLSSDLIMYFFYLMRDMFESDESEGCISTSRDRAWLCALQWPIF